jgi:SAM-dependent methyltransferase
MTPDLLQYLCDPYDFTVLTLHDAVVIDGKVITGNLVSTSGNTYPIRNGVPRFDETIGSVVSFGDEWNFFNYDLFKINWTRDVVGHNFVSTEYFRGKVIVDCGAGSGMQSKWMAEAGAARVIALELSHAVDGVIKRNLEGVANVDVVQCSIDAPPIRRESIDGIVICHNVIQHTPSVEKTAAALWGLVGKGEFVFNCYMKYPDNPVWMARWNLVYRPLRAVLSRMPFPIILGYARAMAALRFVPVLGPLLEKSQFMIRGQVAPGPRYLKRLYENAVLNTYDWYGSHTYQHQKTPDEIRKLVVSLQPDSSKVQNLEEYLRTPIPPGLAIRISR